MTDSPSTTHAQAARPAPPPSHRRIGEVIPRVEAALAALQDGGCVVIVEDRGGSGAVFAAMAGEKVTTERMNALITAAGGIIAYTISDARADTLALAEIPRRKANGDVPRYTVSVEAARGVSTGISATDRAHTVAVLTAHDTTADTLVRPGHIMPIRVGRHGCLRRPHGPETAHDLVRLAGLREGAALSHVITGTEQLAVADAPAFAARCGWPLLSVSDLLDYRAANEVLVRLASRGVVQTDAGPFEVRVYESRVDHSTHIALTWAGPAADPVDPAPPLVRVHSQCLTGDVLHSRRCDCGDQLRLAMRAIAEARRGVIVYMSQEGRGIGLTNKIRAYALQDAGSDTVEANVQLGFAPDLRDYAIAGQILRDLDMRQIRLMTNNPEKIEALSCLGVEVVQRVPIVVAPTENNRRYLQTKRDRMGHYL